MRAQGSGTFLSVEQQSGNCQKSIIQLQNKNNKLKFYIKAECILFYFYKNIFSINMDLSYVLKLFYFALK